MSKEQIRFECLVLAHRFVGKDKSPDAIIARAKRYLEFVRAGTRRPTPPKLTRRRKEPQA